jgi:acyl-CoA synthetase (AMP-forming)/AMP-acid ligase II
MFVEEERLAYNLTNDVYVSFLPFFHIYALNCIIVGAVLRRDTAIVMSSFDFKKFLELNQRYKATIAWLVPPVCLMLAKDPIVDQYDLSSWQEITCGAAPLDAALTKALCTRLNVRLREGFGMTETGSGTHLTLRTNPVQGSVGILVPNFTAKIIDEEGNSKLNNVTLYISNCL